MHKILLSLSLSLVVGFASVSFAEELSQKAKLEAIFAGQTNSQTKPTVAWVVKTLDKVAAVRNPTKKLVTHYLGFSTQAAALAAIVSENTNGFRERVQEFGLRLVEFMPDQLYQYDQYSHQRVPSFELKSFSNVQVAADEVVRLGNFLKVLEFPWNDFIQRGNPTSESSEERALFFRDFVERPYHRILTTSPNNRNRKRGAWVMRNFLCDDLTPSSLAGEDEDQKEKPIAAVHSNKSDGAVLTNKINLHATQKSCATCHWKLDYVSGFFRYIGTWGHDFRNRNRELIYYAAPPLIGNDFDDFMAFWKRPDGTWNLGVRRGSLIESPKDWHASDVSNDPVLEDLFGYLKIAPEFRQCLTRRMAKYYINDNLSYDAQWIEQVSDEMAKRPESQSGESFMKILGLLSFSKANQTRDPDPGLCYDYAVGSQPSEIPCNVAQLLKTKCATCHSDESTNLQLGALVQNGNVKTLNHVGDDGKLLTPALSRETIHQRLTTAEESDRMPLGQAPLSEAEQKILLNWLDSLSGVAR